MGSRVGLILHLLAVFYITLSAAVSATAAAQEPLAVDKPRYKQGDAIPVSCLNRTSDTGEHVTDATGALQYIPFPTCNETGAPLSLSFGVEGDLNCTLDFISDSFFHLLEFYVHNDAPLTCRIPARPLSPSSSSSSSTTDPIEGQGSLANDEYVPLIVALTGTLQLSHLHVGAHLNMLLHAAPIASDPGVVAAGTAYSISSPSQPPTRIVIGDALPLRFSVRWYPTTVLPSGWSGVGGHIYMSTLVYCLLSAGAAAAVCVAWFRGVELPRRLRNHGKDRLGGGGMEGGRLGGYGYGVSGGTSAFGKRD